MTPIIGRSHGIHAEPTTFGIKLAYAYAEFARAPRAADRRAQGSRDLRDFRRGRHLRASRSARGSACRQGDGARVEPVSTQIIPRDRHAMYFATLGVVASSIERLAIEIRHLQRTEVLEAEEYFSPGQKGSSAMPHKRNPVLTENITGLARLVRGYAIPAMENVALWHERDISHSSVERMIGPDSTVTLDFALNRLGRRDRQARGLSGEHAEESRPPRRARAFTARADRADAKRRRARGRLPDRAGERDEGLARRRRFPHLPESRSARDRKNEREARSRRISISAITSSTSIRFSSACLARTRSLRHTLFAKTNPSGPLMNRPLIVFCSNPFTSPTSTAKSQTCAVRSSCAWQFNFWKALSV